jgi:phospholipid N-methyltransferase
LSSLGLFLREFINDPRSIGAVAPSSRKLARHMAAFVPPAHDGLVVDLGAGTGVITGALLEQGFPAERLVAVERSPRMAASFRERFPQVPLIEGDAQRLDILLGRHFGPSFQGVDFVVSGLPLRSLPRAVVRAIEEKIQCVLTRHGRFIQFTYDLRPVSFLSLDRLKHCMSQMVWYNLPPARIDVFAPKRNGHHAAR